MKWSEVRKWCVKRMFIGKYTNTLDQKGRVLYLLQHSVPTLVNASVLTRGSEEKSLYIYPEDEWKEFVEKPETP